MAKIFQLDNEKVARKNRSSPMEADIWFESQQPMLLWMANKSNDGRKLLCIEQTNFDRIDELAADHVSQFEYVRDGGTLLRPNLRKTITTGFRSSPKWMNLITYQWDWFCELAREYYSLMERKQADHVGQFLPVCLWKGFQFGSTDTSYPSPTAGVAPFDGYCGRSVTSEAPAVIANGAGTSSVDGLTSGIFVYYNDIDSSHNFSNLYRSIFGFDTSGVGGGSIITSAFFNNTGAGTSQGGINPPGPKAVGLFRVIPSSSSAITASDYNIANWGSTLLSSTKVYTDFSDLNLLGWSLNAAGLSVINKSGFTWIGGRWSQEQVTSSFSFVVVNTYFAEETGISRDPQLVVTYNPAVPSAPASGTVPLFTMGY